jgi:hypothetical protein
VVSQPFTSPSDPAAAAQGVGQQKPADERLTWLNDAIYRDVILADAKAVFAMSLSAIGVGGTASILGAWPEHLTNPLASQAVAMVLGAGVLMALLAIVSACATVLPRKYVGAFDEAQGKPQPHDGWTIPALRNWLKCDDLWRTFWCNVSASADGGSSRIDEMYEALRDRRHDSAAIEAVWLVEIGRLAEVRRRKYWWAGRSIILSTASLAFLLAGIALALWTSRHVSPNIS